MTQDETKAYIAHYLQQHEAEVAARREAAAQEDRRIAEYWSMVRRGGGRLAAFDQGLTYVHERVLLVVMLSYVSWRHPGSLSTQRCRERLRPPPTTTALCHTYRCGSARAARRRGRRSAATPPRASTTSCG
jgi:hypothetical protein